MKCCFSCFWLNLLFWKSSYLSQSLWRSAPTCPVPLLHFDTSFTSSFFWLMEYSHVIGHVAWPSKWSFGPACLNRGGNQLKARLFLTGSTSSGQKNIKGFVPFTLFIIISEFNVEDMIFDVSFWLKGSTKHGQCSPVFWDCMVIMQRLTYQHCQLYNYILMLWAVLHGELRFKRLKEAFSDLMTRDVSPVSSYRHGSDHHFQPPPPGVFFSPLAVHLESAMKFWTAEFYRWSASSASCVQGSRRQQHSSVIRGLLKSKGELISSSVVW